jgi:hypothetical protein
MVHYFSSQNLPSGLEKTSIPGKVDMELTPWLFVMITVMFCIPRLDGQVQHMTIVLGEIVT